ncbi:hypothetical protein E4U16_001867 [Claviceps sp. LM84 group G4]|nr:hypothetical protein E4U16_001867 [Claviceps sp. LM84 group G4]
MESEELKRMYQIIARNTDHLTILLNTMKICILVASLLSLGASALPEAEESITVGGHTYKGGDLPKGELKVLSYPSPISSHGTFSEILLSLRESASAPPIEPLTRN